MQGNSCQEDSGNNSIETVNFKSKVISLVLGSLVVVVVPVSAFSKEIFPIYYPTTLPAKARQDAIRDQVGGADLEPVVYAKQKDFHDEFTGKNPSQVLAPAAFQELNPDYRPALQLFDSSGSSEKYLVLSLSDDWKKKPLSEGRIGIIEEVPREKAKEFLKLLFPFEFKLIKSVSKPEDLYPLLVFKTVDLILITPENHEALKQKFTTAVTVVGESKTIPLPRVFVHKSKDTKEFREKLKATLMDGAVARLGFKKLEIIEGESP